MYNSCNILFRCCNAYRLLYFNPQRFKHSRQKVTRHIHELLRTMPKEPVHVSKLQNIREKTKDNKKYEPGVVRLEVIGSGSRGSSRSLYLFTDHTKYLFNCGEGTQRLSAEHHMKLAKLEHIFITHKSWENLGGLPGIALTIQDIGVPIISLHGPAGIRELFHATEKFVVLNDLHIVENESNYYEDGILKVEKVPILGKNDDHGQQMVDDFQVIEEDDQEDSILQESRGKRNSTTLLQTSASKRKKEEKYSGYQKNISMAFICQLHPKSATLVLERCVEKGVPPGPLLGKLKNGEDVTLQDGTVVLSSDVCSQPEEGPVFIVLECPSEDYLDSLTANPEISKYQTAADSGDVPLAIIHFSPPKVMQHPRYKEWMQRFSKVTNHVTMNELNFGLGSVAVHRLQYKLHMLHSHMFPLLQETGVEHLEDVSVMTGVKCGGHIPMETQNAENNGSDKQHSEIGADAVDKDNIENTVHLKGVSAERIENGEIHKLDNIIQENVNTYTVECSKNDVDSHGEAVMCISDGGSKTAPVNEEFGVPLINGETATTFHLRPRKGYEQPSVRQLNPREFIEETMNIEGMSEALVTLYAQQEEIERTNNHQEFPQILFLGTGSCIPNKTRNTSGILVKLSDTEYMILDCGEGTYSQLIRYFGNQKVEEVLQKIQAIYISHLHADHHMGLISILRARRRAFENASLVSHPVLLLAPDRISTWLSLYHQKFEPILNEYMLFSNVDLMSCMKKSNYNSYEALLLCLGLQAVETVKVKHCPNAFGVALMHKDGWKIVYSGDCMPSRSLIELGQNCDLLIHEATMEDELEKEARLKYHSTTSQAIEVGKAMHAKYTLLTHFSQRYSRIPIFNENFGKNVGIAFDNMLVKLSDLPMLHLFYPSLKLMFAEHYEEMVNKTAKKLQQWRREREAELQ